MIFLHKPYIKNIKNKSRLIFNIDIDNEQKEVWYEVDKEYGKYLCDDRVDAILVGVLHYAMEKGHDIESDSYVTDEILYKIKTYLIPSLTRYAETLNKITISIKTKKPLEGSNGVGTGCSGGIDSLHSIIVNKDQKNKDFRLTHLCLNNVGSFNSCYKENSLEEVREFVIDKAKRIAKEVGLPLIITDSNIQNVIMESHYLTSTYSSVFAILCMQKLWKIYYYGSSGLDYSKFSIIDNDKHACSHYELLSLDCYSSSGLKIYSEGGAMTRFDKIERIYKNPLVKKYTHTCTVKMHNCNQCPKCKGLLLALYALTDDLKDYKMILDIDYFYEHKHDYFKWIYEEHLYGLGMYEHTYQELLKRRDDFRKVIDEIENEKKEDISEPVVNDYNYYEEEYKKVVNSRAFKVGSIIMYIPQKLKAWVIKTKNKEN